MKDAVEVTPKNPVTLRINGTEITISINNSGGIAASIPGDCDIEVGGDFTFSVKGETNIVSRGLNLDTLYDWFGTVFKVNGRWARQIRFTKEALFYRADRAITMHKKKKKFLAEVRQTTGPKRITEEEVQHV